MNKNILWLIITLGTVHATQLFIKNWSTFPVVVSEAVIPEPTGNKAIKTNINVQAGQSLPLRIKDKGTEYTNFNQINVNFNVDGYTKEETDFFPDASTQEASLSFTDTGYKRFPYNILIKK